MSYIALYRKWRPLVFKDVVEQEHVVKTLKYSVSTGRIAHAYLFCGTRGTGKTTMAKIFSRAINCLDPKDGDPCNQCEICKGILSDSILDVVEIDAASNNSVDNVREIRDEVIYAPTHAKYKVYIIDEVHMLSAGAFNALLKTLEEPPSHVVFILATTDPHKLPATILSRCQRFDFRRISLESIMGRLCMIAKESGVNLHSDAARLIAKLSDGALRDAISILDQCISRGNTEVSHDDVLSMVGIVTDDIIGDIFDAINGKNIPAVLEHVDSLVMSGKDISQFVSELVYYCRNLLICAVTDKPRDIIDASDEAMERMKSQCASLSREELTDIIKELSALEANLKWAIQPRIMLEAALIKLCGKTYAPGSDDVMARLTALERKLNNLSFTGAQPVQADANAPVEIKLSARDKSERAPAKSVSRPPAQKAEPQALGIKPLQNWDDVLKQLKSSGRMVLYTNLLDTKAFVLDNKFVGVVFEESNGFKKMLVSKAENREVLEGILSNALGREIRVKCLSGDELDQSKAESPVEEKDELLEKAQDLATRLNVPLNIIDE